MAHTDGPWKINTANGRLPVVRKILMPYGEAATYTATIQTNEGAYVCKLDFGYGKKQDEANANLIAAAPDLLAALKFMTEHRRLQMRMSAQNKIPYDVELAVAAITKAEGD